ncbi:ATP-dependent RNA helicase ddx46-like [Diorhabda carinulata]|uniref:ATP-dependent RNA helicase ddx46-like n=1 Tax=Diorhabda carinulata TaxID=1163345 RepID=UPI0025A28997|nr:ATP-dependent RNA helicase ddx46-like [Diorhabda carinulata]
MMMMMMMISKFFFVFLIILVVGLDCLVECQQIFGASIGRSYSGYSPNTYQYRYDRIPQGYNNNRWQWPQSFNSNNNEWQWPRTYNNNNNQWQWPQGYNNQWPQNQWQQFPSNQWGQNQWNPNQWPQPPQFTPQFPNIPNIQKPLLGNLLDIIKKPQQLIPKKNP